MGRTHAISGVATCLAVDPVLTRIAPGMAPHGMVGVATAGLVCAGAALLPDLDHPSATIAHTFGPVTAVLSRVVARLSGGHRHATHSLLFTAAAGAAGWWAGTAGRWVAWPVMVLLAGLGMCAIGVTHTTTALVAATAATAPAAFTGGTGWLGPAIAVGVAAHLVGDCLTGHGCPLAWPARHNIGLPLVNTGGRVEHLLITPALIAGTALQAAHLAMVWPFTT